MCIRDSLGDAPNVPHTLLPFLDFRLIWNRGISYGFMGDAGAGAQIALSVAAAVVTLFLIVLMTRQTHRRSVVAYALIIGGAVGNLIDRALYGAVVDFVSLHAGGYYWYIFNLADVWITFGVIALLWPRRKGGS